MNRAMLLQHAAGVIEHREQIYGGSSCCASTTSDIIRQAVVNEATRFYGRREVDR